MDIDQENLKRAKAWLEDHPEISHLNVGAADLNGVLRGKRIPLNQLDKVFKGGLRMPLSSLGVDIWGCDPEGSDEVFKTGDADGLMKPTERGLIELSGDPPECFLPVWLFEDNGDAFEGDPRQALASLKNSFAEKGLTPVIASELEFYLIDPEANPPRPAKSPDDGKRQHFEHVLSVDTLDAFATVLEDLYKACEAQNLPADSVISEGGRGQLEVNLLHNPDPLKAADDAFLLKRIVKRVARSRGLGATFMAKPFGGQAGNGMHLHISLLDDAGNNVFDDGTERGSAMMRHGVGGMLEAMYDSFLIFAPHANSYRRFRKSSHAPSGIAWGYENRTTAIRIPGGDPKSRRIEHRLAGADANPYLVIAAVLGAMLNGIEQKIEPSVPLQGDAYGRDLPPLPADWPTAIETFKTSEKMSTIFPRRLVRMLISTKEQERERFLEEVSFFEYRSYLDSV